MKKLIKKTLRFILLPFVLIDYIRYKNKDVQHRFSIPLGNVYPCIRDKVSTTGFDRHYVYHTSWAARIVKEINPKKHVDISSSLYFCGIISAFVPVDFYDYRPAKLDLSNLASKRGDLMNLPFASNSIPSISCMHTVEHVGLGRYGDPIDPEGDLKAIKELERVTARGGSTIFVVPIGKPLLAWNAHRVYSYEQITSAFQGFTLKEFSLIPESENHGGLIRNANPELVKNEDYACGCFWFIKN
jgi:SAM-dependent methyltransferase